jgi:plastocyanin
MRRIGMAMACGALATGTLMMAAPQTGVAAGSGKRSVSIEQRQFAPRELTVNVGDEVTWTNRDGEQVHSVTADDGSFDSNPACSTANPKECMSNHDTFKHTFGAEGRFPYFSRTFGGPGGQGTSGVVVVQAAPLAPPKKGATTSTTAGPGAKP